MNQRHASQHRKRPCLYFVKSLMLTLLIPVTLVNASVETRFENLPPPTSLYSPDGKLYQVSHSQKSLKTKDSNRPKPMAGVCLRTKGEVIIMAMAMQRRESADYAFMGGESIRGEWRSWGSQIQRVGAGGLGGFVAGGGGWGEGWEVVRMLDERIRAEEFDGLSEYPAMIQSFVDDVLHPPTLGPEGGGIKGALERPRSVEVAVILGGGLYRINCYDARAWTASAMGMGLVGDGDVIDEFGLSGDTGWEGDINDAVRRASNLARRKVGGDDVVVEAAIVDKDGTVKRIPMNDLHLDNEE